MLCGRVTNLPSLHPFSLPTFLLLYLFPLISLLPSILPFLSSLLQHFSWDYIQSQWSLYTSNPIPRFPDYINSSLSSTYWWQSVLAVAGAVEQPAVWGWPGDPEPRDHLRNTELHHSHTIAACRERLGQWQGTINKPRGTGIRTSYTHVQHVCYSW